MNVDTAFATGKTPVAPVGGVTTGETPVGPARVVATGKMPVAPAEYDTMSGR